MESTQRSIDVLKYFYRKKIFLDDVIDFDSFIEDGSSLSKFDEDNLKIYFSEDPNFYAISSFNHLNKMYDNLNGETKVKDLYVVFENKCLYRIRCDNYKIRNKLYMAKEPIIKSLDFNLKNEDYKISFGMGISELSFINIIEEKYSVYYPPFSKDDIYIYLEGNDLGQLNDKDILGIIESYLFQIKCSFGIDMYLSPRNDGKYLHLQDNIQMGSQMRPLLFGEGILDVVSLFNKASLTDDLNSSLLSYTQLLEYISLTVVNRKLVEEVTNKLNTDSVFSPDSNYIIEMGDIFISNYKLRQKDGELIKAVVTSCCDIFELKKVAPNYMKKIKQINDNSKSENKGKALDEIADYIVNTRNRLSHSKPNYQNTGKVSATDEELPELLELLKTICEQSIRWFGNIPEKDRITTANSHR
ncbi:hypothetical protein [Carnobacterium maltaromaticum]|uniref:hypothetical protein n=1 Tax=Carnobacterium maltaromaticum TaxID=2751 RepID=UPI0039AFB6FB